MDIVTRMDLKISYNRLLRAFRKMGFVEDYLNSDVVVLRRTQFPFERLVIPNQHDISVELVKLYLNDLGITWEDFYSHYLQE